MLLIAVAVVALALLWWGVGYSQFAVDMARAHNSSATDAGMVGSMAVVTGEQAFPVPTQTVFIPSGGVSVRVLGDARVEVGDRVLVLHNSGVARYADASFRGMPWRLFAVAGALVSAGMMLLVTAIRWTLGVYQHQRAVDGDLERVRFAGHHRHGA